MIRLRDYQQTIADSVRAAYARGRRAPLVVLPTGGGKTVLFSYVTQCAIARGRTVLLLAHRAELVLQIAGTLARFECPHEIIAPGPIIRQSQVAQFREHGRVYTDPKARAYVASAQTLLRRLETVTFTPDIIVVDEAHHLTEASTWGQIVAHWPDAKLLPVTATPIRLDGRGLGMGAGGFADDMICGPTMRELIDAGSLSRYRIFAPPTALDLTGVRTRAGDYAKDQLADALDKPTITGDVVAHYRRLAPGKRAVAFCVSVAHAQHVAREFQQAGIVAEFLDGTIDATARAATIARFSAGETQVLLSCDIVSEGFDLPAIEVAILLRPTKSLSLYLQQVGRALRPFPGKAEAIILDHVGAVITHGLPDEDRDWTLDGVTKRKRAPDDSEPEVKITTCPECFAIHAAAPACPACGHTYPVTERKLEQADGELVELGAAELEAIRRQKRVLQGKAQSIDELLAQGISRPRAQKILEAREAKAELVDSVVDTLGRLKAAGEPAGPSYFELRRMKPKELRELLTASAARLADRQAAAVA